MDTYIRKLHPHDLTHEVSVQSYYVYTFFHSEGYMSFINVNDPTHAYEVCIRNVTDPRFGGQFKAIYRNEEPRVGDFLLIKKIDVRSYSLELIKPSSVKYKVIKAKFECHNKADRHAIIDI